MAHDTTFTRSFSAARPKRRKLGAVFFALGSVLAAGIAGLVVFDSLQKIPAPQMQPVVHILAAAHPIPLGAILTEEDVAVIDWPKESAPSGFFSSAEPALGRVVTRALVKGEPISNQRLAIKEAGQGVEALIPKGMRAQSLRVTEESGVAGFLKPGDFVDMIVMLQGNNGLESRTPLQNIRVIAVGEQYQQDASNEERVRKSPVITVLVTPQQSSLLAVAQVSGRVALTLRNGYDPEEVATVGFSGQDIHEETITLEETQPAKPKEEKKGNKGKRGTQPDPIVTAPAEKPAEEPKGPELPQKIVGGKLVSGTGGKIVLVPMQ